VLELAIAQALYERFPESSEGELTRIRATVVSRASCAVVGHELGLADRLGAAGSGRVSDDDLGRLTATRSVVSAVLEAALGALYVTYGFERVREPIVEAFSEQIEHALTSSLDAKTALQEELARRRKTVSYTVLETAGPPHVRRFTCAAVIDGEIAGVGTGPSKKAAEQIAAREALAKLPPPDPDTSGASGDEPTAGS
jgi:ribonuclease-3